MHTYIHKDIYTCIHIYDIPFPVTNTRSKSFLLIEAPI